MKIALTGAMGSGKSAALKIFASHKIKCFESDTICKEFLDTENAIKAQVKTLLGDEVYDENGIAKKSLIAQKVFADKSLLEQYEKILHTRLISKIIQDNTKEIHIYEISLLYEKGLEKYFDICLSVFCSERIRLERLSGRTLEKMPQRDFFQLDPQKKLALADTVLFNETTFLFLEKQIENFLNKL